MKLGALQQALYDALTGDATLMALAQGVHIPKAPQYGESEVATPFPYVVIPQMTANPFDTKTSNGGNVLVQVDGYSRSQSDLQINDLQGRVYDVLHKGTLSITGATFVDCLHEQTIHGYEDDGRTRRFVSLYRVTYDEI